MSHSYYTNEGVAQSVGAWAEKDFKRWCGQIMKGVLVVGDMPGHLQSTGEVPLSKVTEPSHRASSRAGELPSNMLSWKWLPGTAKGILTYMAYMYRNVKA